MSGEASGAERPARAVPPAVEGGAGRLRVLVAVAGGVYLLWWGMVELLLPGSFNPLPGRLLVVALSAALLAASLRVRLVERHLSALFTAWTCLLVAHYCYLIVGNRGEATWWVGAFVTFATVAICLQSRREVAVFSLFAMACVVGVAVLQGQLGRSIYVPGLATILLLANLTKRSQVMAQDATSRAEHARGDARRADEQRLQLAAIVESSGDAIVASGLDGVVWSWNEGAERLFGYRAEEMLGRAVSLLAPPGREGEAAANFARLAEGKPVAPVETVRRRKDGSDVDVSITVSPVRDALGQLSGASMAARDISDRKRAEAAVMRAREEAEAANRELEAFSYSVAHDLRAPLRAIDGFGGVLLEDHGAALDAEGLRTLQRMRTAAQQMGHLIDSLLSLGRVTRTSLRAERVDLSALGRESIERLRESQPGRAVEVVIADGLAGRGDGVLLGAALDNLLANAWKFTRHEPAARIELGSTMEGDQTAYFVRDNGAGFDMAFASKLFGVFERLHGPGEFEGNGVGLATVQRIVQRHGGRVWAEGKVGEGACFWFTLGDASER